MSAASTPSSVDPTRISDLPNLVGTTVTVSGWVAHLRSSGKIAFIVMRDGTGTLQCVVPKKEVSEEVWAKFGQLTLNPERAPASFQQMSLCGSRIWSSTR